MVIDLIQGCYEVWSLVIRVMVKESVVVFYSAVSNKRFWKQGHCFFSLFLHYHFRIFIGVKVLLDQLSNNPLIHAIKRRTDHRSVSRSVEIIKEIQDVSSVKRCQWKLWLTGWSFPWLLGCLFVLILGAFPLI